MKYQTKLWVMITIDVVLTNLAVYISLLLRFDGNIPNYYINVFLKLAPLITAVMLAFLLGFKLYNRMWEYASFGEMVAILRATSLGMAIIVAIIYLFHISGLPRSVYIISWILLNAFIGASRLWWRVSRSLWFVPSISNFKKVIIVGAGSAGAILSKEIVHNLQLKMTLIGFADDDKNKQGLMLNGAPVLGRINEIVDLVEEFNIDEIIVAIPSAHGSQIRKIMDTCLKTRAKVRILPGIYQSTDGSLIYNLRNVQMDDLLRREPVQIDMLNVREYISNKSIMITGAGGSIGSELCRQVLNLNPLKLIMVDNDENSLFEIEQELRATYPQHIGLLEPLLLNVQSRAGAEEAFKRLRPQVVFHAAAFKHVPMMERFSYRAIENNVLGTQNIAQMAHDHQVETFILISTDKAVNPSSVMGASKRIAEMIIQDLNQVSNTKYSAVRFGNVLGSRGSVIPTFMKQIERGGPLTITHPEMVRYFMTIPEAVQLVLQAGAMTIGGEIFVLDMGEPVKIVDLARDLIRLAGYEPKDIEIIYSGIRPGEKLEEELFTDREKNRATRHERIFISNRSSDKSCVGINEKIRMMVKPGVVLNNDEVRQLTHYLVPEYNEYPTNDQPAIAYSQIAAAHTN